MKKKREPEEVKTILHDLGLYPEWNGARGRKMKYKLRTLKRGEFLKTPCEPARARAIQTAILTAGRLQRVRVQTESHGTYILTKRIK